MIANFDRNPEGKDPVGESLEIQNPIPLHQPLGLTLKPLQVLQPLGRKFLTGFEEGKMGEDLPELKEVPEVETQPPIAAVKSPEVPDFEGEEIAVTRWETFGQLEAIGHSSSDRSIAIASPLELPIAIAVEAQQYAEMPIAPSGISNLAISSAIGEVPTQWSSLEELVNDNLAIDAEIAFTPFGFQKIVPETPNSDRNSASSPPAQDNFIDPRSREVTLTAPGYGEPEEPDNIEIIARKVYDRIKQRLEIDRERNGRRYTPRSPW